MCTCKYKKLLANNNNYYEFTRGHLKEGTNKQNIKLISLLHDVFRISNHIRYCVTKIFNWRF